MPSLKEIYDDAIKSVRERRKTLQRAKASLSPTNTRTPGIKTITATIRRSLPLIISRHTLKGRICSTNLKTMHQNSSFKGINYKGI